MKKFILALFLSLGVFLAGYAQTAISGSKFTDNTYVGVGVGAATPLTKLCEYGWSNLLVILV